MIILKYLVKFYILVCFILLLSYPVYASNNINISQNNDLVVVYNIKNGKHCINWNKVKGADKYLIKKTSSTGHVTKFIKTNKIKYKEKLDNYYSYTYQIFAFKRGKLLTKSKSFEMGYAYPEISDVRLKQVQFYKVKILWKSNDKTLRYKVFKIVKNKKVLLKSNLKETYYIDNDTKCGNKYEYFVMPYKTFIDKDKKSVKGNNSKHKLITLRENKASIKFISAKKHKITLKINKISGANRYKIYRKFNGRVWKYIKTVKSTTVTDKVKRSGRYMYKVVAGRKGKKKTVWGKKNKDFRIIKVGAIPKYSTSFNPDFSISSNYNTTTLTPIIGKNSASKEQMISYYKSTDGIYPAIYAEKGAPTIEDFVDIVYDLSVEYGIRDEIFFAQICLETGNLNFRGDVSAEQCNFGGLGATGGVAGLSFKDVKEGLTSQIQHLRMYADKDFVYDPVTNVDKRYKANLVGKMPYLEWFTISHNPYGVGWATSLTYKEKVMNIVEAILSQ